MGDVSIIARRLSPVYVQHGWSGNGGYFNNTETSKFTLIETRLN